MKNNCQYSLSIAGKENSETLTCIACITRLISLSPIKQMEFKYSGEGQRGTT